MVLGTNHTLVHIYTARGRIRSADLTLSLTLCHADVWQREIIMLLLLGVIIAHSLESST